MGFARSSSTAVGESSCVEAVEVLLEGSAMRTAVRVVERGIEALRRARSEVWRRCGRIVRLCFSLV